MNNEEWRGLPVVIFGIGGLAKKIKATIDEINRNSYVDIFDLKGFVSDNSKDLGKDIQGIEVISTNNNFFDYAKKFNQIGVVLAFGNPSIKNKLYEEINQTPNILFPNIIHPKAIVYKDNLKLGIGNQIMAGVNICTDVKIGNFNLINLNSTIGHDVEIKDFNVINPLASVSGNVIVENEVLIGTGANILQNIKLKEKSVVGAGSLVNKNVMEIQTVVGIPAKEIKHLKGS